jgi:glycerophosphoryl diester phosphodiesterase
VRGPIRIIAHRAGNDLAVLVDAARRSDVIEADVHLFRGRLEVRHAKTIGPLPVLWERWYLLPRETPLLLLGDLLRAVPEGVDLMLDLKGPDPRLPGAVARAAADWLGSGRRLIVCSRVWWSVERLRGRPGITTLHSAGSRRQIRALLRRHGPGSLEGVSVDHRLLNKVLAAALLERAAQVWCWPVNDAATATRLADWGVTGLITDRPEVLSGFGARSLLSSGDQPPPEETG